MSQILSVDVFGNKKKEKEESEDDKSSSSDEECKHDECSGCGQTPLQQAVSERDKEKRKLKRLKKKPD